MSNSLKSSQRNRPPDELHSNEPALSGREHEYGTRGIAVRGSLDLSNASEMRTAIVDSVLGRCQRLDLDLSQVTFLGPTGLKVLARASKLCKLEGVDLRLVRPVCRSPTRSGLNSADAGIQYRRAHLVAAPLSK